MGHDPDLRSSEGDRAIRLPRDAGWRGARALGFAVMTQPNDAAAPSRDDRCGPLGRA
jgi:hypothetical protein